MNHKGANQMLKPHMETTAKKTAFSLIMCCHIERKWASGWTFNGGFQMFVTHFWSTVHPLSPDCLVLSISFGCLPINLCSGRMLHALFPPNRSFESVFWQTYGPPPSLPHLTAIEKRMLANAENMNAGTLIES